jgi:hypothetical protein
MAGRSRFPGIICAGRDGEHFVGYPLNRFQSLMAGPIDIEATFALFRRTGKIELEVTSEGPPKLYKIELLNWAKYQSEYQRLKKYRKPAYAKSTLRSTAKVTPQKERERRIQKETEKEKQSTAAETAAVAPGGADTASAGRIFTAFKSIGVTPFGAKPFQEEWAKAYEEIADDRPSSFVAAMEATIQTCNALGAKVPGKFFGLKRAIEKMEVEVCFRKPPQ